MKIKQSIMYGIIFIVASGCASLFPSSKGTIQSSYSTFNEAKTAFDKIIPYKTTTSDLKDLHFDPFETSNIEILTYLDIIQRFMPNTSIKKEDLDEGLQDCIAAKDNCRAYKMILSNVESQRHGNLFLDLFNFRRKTKKSGWSFKALIVMKEELVVYKLWGGKPSIDEALDKKNPLGPLQDPAAILIGVAGESSF